MAHLLLKSFENRFRKEQTQHFTVVLVKIQFIYPLVLGIVDSENNEV